VEKILFVPNPILRKNAESLKKITSKDIEISKRMIEIMLKAPGVGLAANQIGILKKIVTVNIYNEKKNTDKIYTLFNPTIISYSKKKILMEEGCLSLPKQYAEVERSEEIILEYLNSKNELIKEKKIGFEARVLQHEIDHLQGKLFVDYLSSLKRNMLIKRVQKLKKMGEI
jgi:peptide deformylase